MTGFETLTDTGTVQFSSELVFYVLLKKEAVTTLMKYPLVGQVKFFGFYSLLDTGLPYGTDTMCAVYSNTDTPVLAIPYTDSSGSTANACWIIASKVQADVQCFVFAPTKKVQTNPNASGAGLQIFGADTSISYDSQYPPAIIKNWWKNPSIANGASTGISLDGSRTHAFSLLGTQRRYQEAYTANSVSGYTWPWHLPVTWPGVRKINSSSFAIEPVTLQIGAGGPLYGTMQYPAGAATVSNGTLVAIDVTGM